MPHLSQTRLGRLLLDRGVVRPPSLQTEQERTASRLELFFDLAFVLVIAELAGGLRKHQTGHGVLVFTGLFTVVWWSWMSSTLYANRFDHDDAVYRLHKLSGMFVVLGLAASVSNATGKYASTFILCYVGLRLLLLSQYARAYRHVVEARAGIRIYLAGTAAGALLWAASLATPAPARYVLWAAGVLVDAMAPLLVTVSRAQVPLHPEHLPERSALFVILVLGESVAGIAHGVSGASWTGRSVAVAAACFVLTAALWWSYFDLAGAAAKHLLNEAGGSAGGLAHDVYVYGQLPLCLALAAVGAGVQTIIRDSPGEATAGTRAVLAGGVALYLASISLTNAGMSQRGRNGWWWALPAVGVAFADTLFDLPALVVASVLAALVVVVVIVGLEQEARGRVQLEPL